MKSTDFVTKAEAARHLGITKGAVTAAVQRGELREHLTAGGTGLLSVRELEEWDRQRKPRGRGKRQARAAPENAPDT